MLAGRFGYGGVMPCSVGVPSAEEYVMGGFAACNRAASSDGQQRQQV